MNAIEIRGVTKSFGAHRAVDDLTITVPEGAIYGFIGPNGSGKSTTIRMIMNIILPDTGQISIFGDHTTSAARDAVGYLPEERGLYRKMRVLRLLTYFGELKGGSAAEVAKRADEWLERLGLAQWRNHRVEALSKGMAQKIQFIASVVSNPRLLILDEPFSGLDPVNMDALRDGILEMRRRGTTIIFSTHDMPVAERMCDRIFMIFKGKKVLDGTLDEIQARYGADTVRIRTTAGPSALAGQPEVVEVNDYGQLQEVHLRGDPQELLRRLAGMTTVQHFELARPSLHDIFVRIAKPKPEEITPRA